MNERKLLRKLSKNELIDILLDMQAQYKADALHYHTILAENIELVMKLEEEEKKETEASM